MLLRTTVQQTGQRRPPEQRPHFLRLLKFLQARKALLVGIQLLIDDGELRDGVVDLGGYGGEGRRIDARASHGV